MVEYKTGAYSEAYGQGRKAFFTGQLSNPYDQHRQKNSYRDWDKGFNAGYAINHEKVAEREHRETKCGLPKGSLATYSAETRQQFNRDLTVRKRARKEREKEERAQYLERKTARLAYRQNKGKKIRHMNDNAAPAYRKQKAA